MEHFIVNYLPFVLAVIGAIVWLVRLEGKTDAAIKSNTETQKDIDELRIRHEGLDSKIVEQLARVRESLARLEGYFSGSTSSGNNLKKD
jgi:hypothetical protein